MLDAKTKGGFWMRLVAWLSMALLMTLPAVWGGNITPAAAAAESEPAPVARDESPAAKMARRFPQKVRVGDLKGQPILDDGDVTLGKVQSVVRSPEGQIKLIVGYSRWFGWFGRPVAVPIEVVAILARQIASVDMKPEEYAKAATWTPGTDATIPDDEIIRIAVTRR